MAGNMQYQTPSLQPIDCLLQKVSPHHLWNTWYLVVVVVAALESTPQPAPVLHLQPASVHCRPTENLLLTPPLNQDASLLSDWKPNLWYSSVVVVRGGLSRVSHVGRERGEGRGGEGASCEDSSISRCVDVPGRPSPGAWTRCRRRRCLFAAITSKPTQSTLNTILGSSSLLVACDRKRQEKRGQRHDSRVSGCSIPMPLAAASHPQLHSSAPASCHRLRTFVCVSLSYSDAGQPMCIAAKCFWVLTTTCVAQPEF